MMVLNREKLMEDCLFCRLIKNEIPCEKIFENEKIIAFKDINPMAKVHHLFIHKSHTENVNQLIEESEQIKDIFLAIREWTIKEGLNQAGFRVVTNCGQDAGQSVFHTHFHVLGGEKLGSFGRR